MPSLGTVLYNTSNVADLNTGAVYWNGSRWISLTPYFSVNSTVVGAGSNASSDGAIGTNALAAGVNTTAMSTNAVAVGTGATSGKTDGAYTTAPTNNLPGTTTTVNVASQPNNTVAIGTGAQSSAESGIAIGTGAKVYQGWNFDNSGNPVANNYGVAIGTGATAINNNIVMGNVGAGNLLAAGSNTNPKNINNVTIGNGAGSGVTGNENVIMGYQAATGMNSIGANVAIGKFAATNATFTNAVVLGSDAGTNAAGNLNIAIGASAGVGVTIDPAP